MEWHVEDCNYKIVVFFFCETPPQVATLMKTTLFIDQWLNQGGGGGRKGHIPPISS